MRQAIIHPGLSISPKPVRPEPAEGPFMVRQAHHERFFAPNFAQWTIWVHACYPCLIGKLILHPLAVFVSLAVLPRLGMPPLDPDLRMAAIVMAAMPMLSIYPILAQIYGQEDFSAAALLIATAASFFTLSGLLWVLRVVPM